MAGKSCGVLRCNISQNIVTIAGTLRLIDSLCCNVIIN